MPVYIGGQSLQQADNDPTTYISIFLHFDKNEQNPLLQKG